MRHGLSMPDDFQRRTNLARGMYPVSLYGRSRFPDLSPSNGEK
jgi:hypothetical protein